MLGVYFCMAALTYYLAMNKQVAKTEKEEEPKHQSKIIPIRENLSPNGESKHIIGAKEKYLGGYRNKNNAFLDLMDLRKLDQKGLSDSLENDGI